MSEHSLSEVIRKTRRVVVKIGSSLLVDKTGFSYHTLSGVAQSLAHLKKEGIEVVLVSSGAIASGMACLGFTKKPIKISELQACAAVGQPLLIQMYQKAFSKTKLQAAQVLLTRDDLSDRSRFLNAKHTLNELLSRGAIPIINENDTVVVEEIRVGDNDNLAALVTNLVDADLLILLTDQDGFYTSDPRQNPKATRIPVVENVDKDSFARASDTSRATSVGGMLTKLEAAKKTAQFGISTIIAGGKNPQILRKIFQGADVGTLFLSSIDSLTARKHWIAYTLQPQGTILVDEGAHRALREGKKSLLPSGIIGLEGSFREGDAVDIADREKNTFARGLTAYPSNEIALIQGKKTSELLKILGYKGPDEVIHRNDLVLV